MTAQEKAKQLVDSFMDLSEEQEYNTPRYMSKEMAKQSALIAVDELIKWDDDCGGMSGYLIEIKEEIEKL